MLDRHGQALAASEDAATIYATPYQVKNPPQAAEKLATILDEDPADVLKSLTEESGFSYVAKKVDVPTAARIERLELPGIGELPDSRRTYPQGDLAGQVIGAVGSENEGLTGLEAGEDSVLAGSDGERRIVKDALGEPIRLETIDRSRGRQRHPAHPRPGDRGEDRAGARRSRRNLRAEGGDGDRRRPAQLADPGDGQLAAGRPRRPLRSELRRPAQPGDRVHLRARLDLQGVHGRRRARGKRSDAGNHLHAANPSSTSPTA